MPKLQSETKIPETVLIEVPVAEVLPQTWGHHINAHLSPEQSQALRRVAVALDRLQARLSNGRRVVTSNDTLKYLLEQIGAE